MTTIAETEVKVEAEAVGPEVRRIAAKTGNWSSPIVLAIFAAAVAGFGNAVVLWWNGQLEDRRAEHARILEVIKTGNVKQAAENLEFLVQVGLVASPTVSERIKLYAANAKSGVGPALPARTAWISDVEWNNAVPSGNANTDHLVVRPRSASAPTK